MGRRGMLMAVAALLLPASAQALTANQTVLVDPQTRTVVQVIE